MTKKYARNQFVKYITASAIALLIDYGSYWIIANTTNFSLPISAVIGYSIGLIAAYFLIAGPVYEDRWLSNRRPLEFFLFAASGGLGALVTYAVVSIYVYTIGIDLHKSKFSAAGLSFLAMYLFRRHLVFRKNTSQALPK